MLIRPSLFVIIVVCMQEILDKIYKILSNSNHRSGGHSHIS